MEQLARIIVLRLSKFVSQCKCCFDLKIIQKTSIFSWKSSQSFFETFVFCFNLICKSLVHFFNARGQKSLEQYFPADILKLIAILQFLNFFAVEFNPHFRNQQENVRRQIFHASTLCYHAQHIKNYFPKPFSWCKASFCGWFHFADDFSLREDGKARVTSHIQTFFCCHVISKSFSITFFAAEASAGKLRPF